MSFWNVSLVMLNNLLRVHVYRYVPYCFMADSNAPGSALRVAMNTRHRAGVLWTWRGTFIYLFIYVFIKRRYTAHISPEPFPIICQCTGGSPAPHVSLLDLWRPVSSRSTLFILPGALWKIHTWEKGKRGKGGVVSCPLWFERNH